MKTSRLDIASDQRPRRRWRRRLLGVLVLLMVLASLAAGWLAIQLRHARNQKRVATAIQQAGGRLLYAERSSSVPRWLRQLLGEQFFQEVRGVNFDSGGCTPSILETLQQYPLATLVIREYRGSLAGMNMFDKLEYLDLSGARISDGELYHLRAMIRLQRLELNDTRIGDAGLSYLKGLDQLRILGLNGSHVTDAGLPTLAAFEGLQYLYLDRTGITDAGLVYLEKMRHLKMLSFEGTKVTPRWVRNLQEALPDTMISYSTTPAAKSQSPSPRR